MKRSLFKALTISLVLGIAVTFITQFIWTTNHAINSPSVSCPNICSGPAMAALSKKDKGFPISFVKITSDTTETSPCPGEDVCNQPSTQATTNSSQFIWVNFILSYCVWTLLIFGAISGVRLLKRK